MTEYRTTLSKDDTIVLVPSRTPKGVSNYSGALGKGLTSDYFMLDEQGPFPVKKGHKLVIHRVDGVFDSFEWVPIQKDDLPF
jgi:hypothetical protein